MGSKGQAVTHKATSQRRFSWRSLAFHAGDFQRGNEILWCCAVVPVLRWGGTWPFIGRAHCSTILERFLCIYAIRAKWRWYMRDQNCGLARSQSKLALKEVGICRLERHLTNGASVPSMTLPLRTSSSPPHLLITFHYSISLQFWISFDSVSFFAFLASTMRLYLTSNHLYKNRYLHTP